MKKFLIPLLIPLSWIYHLGLIADRNLKLKRRIRLSKAVVSIGNLTWGGTGKTPLQIKLISDFLAHQIRPALLTRGYKGNSGYNDEVLLLRKYFPTVPLGVGANRATSATEILASHPVDVFILDDGFQHWALDRDLDIVCIDATNPWGGDHLIPWGQLREPATALKRSHAVVVTRGELVGQKELGELLSQVAQLASHDRIFTCSFSHQLMNWKNKQVEMKPTLQGSRVLAVSAIGNPRSFEENLKAYGADVVSFRFQDHHVYSEQDLNQIEAKAKQERVIVVMTEKDEIKLRQTRWGSAQGSPLDLYVLHAQVQFSHQDEIKWSKMINEFFHR